MSDNLAAIQGLITVQDQQDVEKQVLDSAISSMNKQELVAKELKLLKIDKILAALEIRLDRILDQKQNDAAGTRVDALMKKIDAAKDEKVDLVERIQALRSSNSTDQPSIPKHHPFIDDGISSFGQDIPLVKGSNDIIASADDSQLDNLFNLDNEGNASSSFKPTSKIESDYDDDDNGNGNVALANEDTNVAKSRYQKSEFEDDGIEYKYQKRLSQWVVSRRLARLKSKHGEAFDKSKVDMDLIRDNLQDEMYEPDLKYPDVEYDGNLKLPGSINHKLFGYQRTCIKWLWELYSQEAGGVLGDEMGLGKTVQIIAFLASLAYSRKLNGPILIVVPATILRNWVNEFHKWWPYFRVVILHSSGCGMSSFRYDSGDEKDDFIDDFESEEEEEPRPQRRRKTMDQFDSELESSDENVEAVMSFHSDRRGKAKNKRRKKTVKRAPPSGKSSRAIVDLIDRIARVGHVILTTYAAVRLHKKLLKVDWAYCILDEGHKIRNPDSSGTLACKQIRTPHRIILSGTVIQNNLIDLWSVYDFVFPGKLGTLPVFQSQFAIPINIGGYINATKIQIQTAHKCASILQDSIRPYMLRRLKSKVARDLPEKTEQVLFCRLTDFQQSAYRRFLDSEEVSSIMEGKLHTLYGIDILRKICNHPDLLERETYQHDAGYGSMEKSCKMKVLDSLIQMWKKGGHRSLVFCQTRQMLDILEKFVQSHPVSFRYFRMDGTTAIKSRQNLVDQFNNDDSIDIFLLTTKVGGLGINLIGADRVVIFDPDWNPATDGQAKDRSFRIGQRRNVTIYRLMTSGTIEEKIYHRQIFKTFLTNKVLVDPKQQRFFKANDMHDLFTLTMPTAQGGTETGDLFAGIDNVEVTKKHMKNIGNVQDLSAIKDLDKVAEYKNAAEEGDVEDDGEQGILKSLFDKGVHSALQHDAIVGSNSQEVYLVQKEAELVANQAVAALRASRKRIRSIQKDNQFAPTWTGRSGTAGAPKQFGQAMDASSPALKSSASILSQRHLVDHDPSSSADHITFSEGTREALVVKIRDFLASLPNNQATTADIVANFHIVIKSDEVFLFRKMLKGVADFIKAATGKGGHWILKEEFQ